MLEIYGSAIQGASKKKHRDRGLARGSERERKRERAKRTKREREGGARALGA